MKKKGNPIADYFFNNDDNVILKWNHYLEIYHNHFQRFVGKECVIVEIGVYKGGSLQMWKNYFGEKARIIGVDIDPECLKYKEEGIEIFIGSQSDRNFLKNLKLKLPKIDLLIDDGGHTMEQQITTFEELYGHIKDDGIYCCEDVHTSYWKEYGGGFKRKGSFIEYSKNIIDVLNGWHLKEKTENSFPIVNQIDSIHFYDSIILIEKKIRKRPFQIISGNKKKISDLKFPFIYDFDHLKAKLLGVNKQDIELMKTCLNSPDTCRISKELNNIFEGMIWPEKGETMIGFKRLTNIEECLEDVLENKIEGDVIETGVWKGGACIFMNAILSKYLISDKIVWVADSFEGLPQPNPIKYPHDKGDILHTYDELAISLDEVKNNFVEYNLLNDQVKFIVGWFKDTIPNAPINKLSLLRLDGDMYESTIDVLYYLYPKLSIGGYCIVDDWGAIPACRKAVEDYRNTFGIEEPINEIDWTGIYWKKEKEIAKISKDIFNELL